MFIERYIPTPEELAAQMLAITVPEQNVILVKLHNT
jgi:hypothetical protein